MLKISHFARIGGVSIKTLRHYDSIGLLKPAHVEDLSGYRYYTVAQLPQLHHIVALKELGFSLEQIAETQTRPLLPSLLREMLCLKQAEMEERIRVELARLEHVQAQLREIEQGDAACSCEVSLKYQENGDPTDIMVELKSPVQK